MNIKDQGHSLTFIQGHSDSHFQTSFPSKPLGRLKPNFMWSIHGRGEWKFVQTVYVTWPVWPPCPYMVKTLKNLLLWNQKANDLESLYAASGTQVLPSWSNDDPELTLTYFTARSNLIPYAFVWEKGKIMDFSETIVVYDFKVGRFSLLNEYMNHYEYQRSGSFIEFRPRSLRFNIFNLVLLRIR